MNKKKNTSEIEIGNLVKIVLVIVIVFGIFYVLTYYIKKEKTTTNNKNNTSYTVIQYDEILIGSILIQPENEYYVLITNKEDYNSKYKTYINRYSSSNRFYYSLTNSGFNKKYNYDNSNLNVENIEDLRVSQTALLKIRDGRIVESYDGETDVMQKFVDMGN